MSKHPQDTPLNDWPQGWLTLQVACHVGMDWVARTAMAYDDVGSPAHAGIDPARDQDGA